MFQIHPSLSITPTIFGVDESDLECQEVIFQGIHIVARTKVKSNGKTYLCDLPTGQSYLTGFSLDLENGMAYSQENGAEVVNQTSHSIGLVKMTSPNNRDIGLKTEIIKQKKQVILLNTLDSCYGHSYLFLLNIQNILKHKPDDIGLAVLVQPMFRWLIPENMVDEIWTAKMSLNDQSSFFPSLSDKIKAEFNRFDKVFLSRAHLLPTAEAIDIEKFIKIKPFNLEADLTGSRITYVWRQDFGRLWIKSVAVYGLCKVLRIRPVLRYIHWFRIVCFFTFLRLKLGPSFRYTVAGDGKFGPFPSFMEDCRTIEYNDVVEIKLATIYSESAVVIGTHGSSMLVPSSLAGSIVCLMPYMKWSHIGEDIVYRDNDPRIAALRTRYISVSTSMLDIIKIVKDMIQTFKYNIDKFTYDPNEL